MNLQILYEDNDVVAVARNNAKVAFGNETMVRESRAWVEKAIHEKKIINGIATDLSDIK